MREWTKPFHEAGIQTHMLDRALNGLRTVSYTHLDVYKRQVFSPEDATQIHFDVIRSFDRPLIHSELLEKMADKNVKTELAALFLVMILRLPLIVRVM